MSDTITQKKTAAGFLRLTARGQVDDAFARGVAPGCRQHDPHGAADVEEEGELATVPILCFEDGRIAGMWDMARAAPVPMANRDGMFR